MRRINTSGSAGAQHAAGHSSAQHAAPAHSSGQHVSSGRARSGAAHASGGSTSRSGAGHTGAPRTASAGASGGYGQPPRGPKKKKRSVAGRIWSFFWRFCVCMGCLCVMLGCVAAVLLSMYVVRETAADADLLDLDNMDLAYTTIIYARDHDNPDNWIVYDTLSRDNNRIWAYLDEIPDDLKWAFICTEDKTFYEHPGVNFKRTLSATINLILNRVSGGALRLYDTEQGASTIDQ